MKFKFLGLVASLILFGSTQAQATTYHFDTFVSGIYAPAGTVNVTTSGSNATFTVSLPSNYYMTLFALDLNPGATVNAGAYSVNSNAAASFSGYGPFNTTLSGFFGNSLTFTVSNYSGIFNVVINNSPIWFVASFINSSGVIAADVSDGPVATPLPAALPLFAGGAGMLALLGWPRKRKNAGRKLA